MDFLRNLLNIKLLSHPMNWIVVWLVATVWLLAFHVIMTGFKSMQSTVFTNGPLPNGNVLPPAQMTGSYAQSMYDGVPGSTFS